MDDVRFSHEPMCEESTALRLDQILEPSSRLEFQDKSIQDPSAQRPGKAYSFNLRALLKFLSHQHPGFMS
ncbi:MAG: hypothetical protein V3R16_04555 [Nitrospirales bacterium]